jgi:hypothetical protein
VLIIGWLQSDFKEVFILKGLADLAFAKRSPEHTQREVRAVTQMRYGGLAGRWPEICPCHPDDQVVN